MAAGAGQTEREVAPDNRIVRLSSLELTYRAGTADEAALKRRYMTLSVPNQTDTMWRGGVGYVVRARSLATGETFALKRLKEHVCPHGGDEPDERAKKLAASFRQEYDTHRLLSPTGLVPEIHGWAEIGGEPAILMEWVEGVTLHEAAKLLRGRDGTVPLTAVADIGMSVLGALRRIEAVDASLVHRDLSPRNIMIRTGDRALADQAESGIYDICLIDFGSATVEAQAESSFTVVENLWRGATPDYAPPEMLAHDLDGLVELRRSSSIDIYALCSVLYELYTGHTPYEVGTRVERVPYQIKSSEPPQEIELRAGDEGGRLARAILGGLVFEQEGRPTADVLAEEISGWEEARGTSRPWVQTLGAQMESDAGAIPKSAPSLSPTVLRMSTGGTAAARGSAPGQAASTGPGSQRRRRALAAACAVLAMLVIALLAVGSRSHWFGIAGPVPQASVDEYSWEDLSRISRQIADAADGQEAARIEAEYKLVNDEGELDFTQTKNLALADGTQAQVVITGFRHDERSDGSGTAGITFSFVDPVAEGQMEGEAPGTRAWSGTDLRAWLGDEFARQLPDDLANVMVEVKKESVVMTPSDGEDAADVSGYDDSGHDAYYRVTEEESTDEIWVYSEAELGMLYEGSATAEALGLEAADIAALRYDVYASRAVGGEFSQDDVRASTSLGSACWLRTPSEESSSGYETTGDAGYASCTESLGVVPGFCV